MSTNMDYDLARERITDFLKSFYIDQEDGTKKFVYMDKVALLAQRKEVGFYVNMEDVNSHDPELAEWIMENTCRYRNLFYDCVDTAIQELLGNEPMPVNDALDAFIFQRLYMDRKQKEANGDMTEAEDIRRKYPGDLMRRYEVYFKSRDITKALSVRDLKASCVGKLVHVRGVVIRCTEVKPMASVVTYTCDTCGSETYQPVTSQSYTPAVNCPSKDCIDSKANGRLQMQFRGSKFIKFQELRIQEISDQVPIGSIPRAMTIYLTGENTRKAVPGDTVVVSGVLVPNLVSGFKQMTGGLITDVFLDAHTVENNRDENDEVLAADLTDEEVEMLGDDNIYERLAYSIAPEICGMLDEKKTLLLALIGGVDKNASGMKIRGALNVLLMGDPGVAKSQLLSYVDRLAIRSQYTTGRGSSGVGLTASVVKDTVTGEMSLEGGSLVLADRGICCIDEFDKMTESDRTAIHEVMEQQTISIAKAGIMTSLNARVAIIAAANPAFGRYNPSKSIEENIHLPAALLSRFDLIWLIRDTPDREKDRRIADHITYVHRKGEQPKAQYEPIEMQLFRKFIAVCKHKQPVIPESLKKELVDMYVSIRQDERNLKNDNSKNATFTSPRILLGVIRLCTALARLRMRDIVDKEDLVEAKRLMRASKDSLLPHDSKERNPKRKLVDLAYGLIFDLIHQDNMKTLEIDFVFKKCNQKGYDDETVEAAIKRYLDAGVLMRNNTQLISV